MVNFVLAVLFLTIFLFVIGSLIAIANAIIPKNLQNRVLQKLHLDIDNMKPYED